MKTDAKESAKTYRIINHPGVLLINAFLVIFGIITINDLMILSVIAGLVALFLIVRGKRSKIVFIRLALLIPLLLLLTLPVLFGAGLPPSQERIEVAATLSLKIISTGLVLIYIGTSRTHEELLEGLTLLKMPKVMITIIMLSFRYFVMIREDIVKGHRALKSRGFHKVAFKESLSVFGEWIGGFFLKAMDHSEKVYQAMKSRGFTGFIPTEKRQAPKPLEVIIGVLIIIIFIGLHIAERSV